MARIEFGSIKRYASELIGNLNARINHTTPEDIERYHRFLDGRITEADRRDYLSDRGFEIALSASYFTFRDPASDGLSYSPFSSQLDLVNILEKNYQTPAFNVDQALRETAQRKLLSIH